MDIPLEKFITIYLTILWKYFIMYFITLNLRFIINNVVLKIMEIIKDQMKETSK